MKANDLLEMVIELIKSVLSGIFSLLAGIFNFIGDTPSIYNFIKIFMVIGIGYFLFKAFQILIKETRKAVPHSIWDKERTISTKISGSSMMPGFISDINVIFRTFLEKPERGDLVFVRDMLHNNQVGIKRLIGLPGDVIEFDEENGIIKVNGRALHDNMQSYYKKVEKEPGCYSREKIITVPSGKYFILGDNWYNSYDSRHFGPVPQNRVMKIEVESYDEGLIMKKNNGHYGSRMIPMFIYWKDEYEELYTSYGSGYSNRDWRNYKKKVDKLHKEKEAIQ